MQPLYKIPIIPQNLRRDETVVQTADALKYLTEVSNDIFNRINKRIEANVTNLATITKRIEIAQQKVSKLRGAKKATQVFSSSKYPALDVQKQYKSIFSKDHNIVLSRSKYKFKDLQLKDEALETLQFYHVKVGNNNNNIIGNGLGDIPTDVVAVNDLLLYNTGTNPYENYVISDPLQASSRFRKEELANTSNIAAAPQSIIERSTLSRSTTESYFYSPDLGNVPTIDVPLDLPDLPGIADNVRYVDQVGPGIAPSVTTTPITPDLPPLVQTADFDDTTPDLPVVPVPIASTLPDLVELPEPPSQTETEYQTPELVEISKPESPLKAAPVPVANDAHASLMEAIRNAGGTTSGKLKAAPEPKKQPSGDLMADLHAKLSLRRKGISGLKNQEPNANDALDSTTTMQKISAMIPPPPIKVEQSDSTNTEDEDWED